MEERLRRSESRLQLALDAAAMGTWDWDIAANGISWNERARALFDVDFDAPIRYDDFESRLHPDDVARNRRLTSEALQEGDYDAELRVQRPQGGWRWVASRGHVIRDDGGRPLRMIGVVADITERKLRATALERSEQRYRALVRVVSDLTWTTDRDGRFATPQPAWELYTGQRWSQYEGLGWVAALHPDDQPSFAMEWRRSCEAAVPLQVNARLRHAASGRFRHVMWRATPLVEAGGAVREWVGCCNDVDDERLAVEALRDADRRKDRFLHVLSHELRNPLAPLRSAARVLGSARAEPAQRQQAQEVIERQTRQMAQLLDDLLDIARISQGRLAMKLEPITLARVVDSAVDAVQPAMEGKSHELRVSLPPGEVWLKGDAVRLTQALTNVLSNSARYTPQGGNIELEARCERHHVVIEVRDDGIGIASDSLQSIFAMFVQTPEPSAADHAPAMPHGLGMSLAVAREVIQRHGGSIKARSEGFGQGSAFVIELPLMPPPPRAGDDAKDRRVHALARRILVADDNVDAADMLATLLRLDGHEVRAVHDGEQALAVATTWRPDIALLDIGMPGLSGHAVAQKLRADHDALRLRLAALTGWGQTADRERAIAAGFEAHFTKPVDLDELSRWIAQTV
ncbi:MAG TPA: PAS domain-containing protein [Methylibium sp.]|uniref:PAS domain-containing hybrid sensor histidine kinase/response regulator n=1 Tax=Methylibium sp. TaxID=2067992 RepID=UPI002DBD9CA2|nr:PAS domain-containing protein [Methylibium sp.]HEU4459083.1 PAS domain-containing protein [Methylibium sp.]